MFHASQDCQEGTWKFCQWLKTFGASLITYLTCWWLLTKSSHWGGVPPAGNFITFRCACLLRESTRPHFNPHQWLFVIWACICSSSSLTQLPHSACFKDFGRPPPPLTLYAKRYRPQGESLGICIRNTKGLRSTFRNQPPCHGFVFRFLAEVHRTGTVPFPLPGFSPFKKWHFPVSG